jgi:hypothetical protein
MYKGDLDAGVNTVNHQGSHTAINGSKGASLYASMSIVMPDLKSTVKRSSKIVIFSIRRLTSDSSNYVMVGK